MKVGQKVQISISVGFVIVAAITALSGFNGTVMYSLVASFIHEAGHLSAITLLGGKIKELRLKAFAAEIVIDERSFSFYNEALISFCGPLINIITAFVFWTVFKQNEFAVCSLVMGFFHLIPVKGLDGGNALYAIFVSPTDNKTARKILSVVSWLFFAVLSVFGVVVLFVTKFNFSCLILTIILMFETVKQKDSGFLKSKKSA